MRALRFRGRAIARALLLTVLVTGAVAAAAAPAVASGPASLGVTGWQVYSNLNTYANPAPAGVHGNPAEYAAAPAIPAQNDPGWANCGPSSPFRFSSNGSGPLCPNATTIGMAVGSILSGCWSRLNFTSFQALVSIPEGTTISQFSVNMSGADDGARISLLNSQYPNGVTPSAGYIYQGTPQSTGDLHSYVVAGEVNRVVITQVDDCAVGNNLNSAQVFLNGTVIPPAPADTAAPVDNPVPSPAANGAGWNTTDVTVGWNWTDGGSGIDAAHCTQSSTSSGEGTITLNSTCKDNAGNSASDSRTVKVDKTAPADSPVVTPAANGSGWNSSAVTVDWNWTDGGSGIDPSSCTQSSTSSGDGTITLSSTCQDAAGNSATDSRTVKVDATAPADSPVLSPAANGAGWNTGDVTVAWNWTDGGSGIDPSSCTQSSTSAGEGTITLTSTCQDAAGNSASDSRTVKVDTTAPADNPVLSPAANGGGWNNSAVTASWNWTDGGSGIDPSSCTQSSTSAGEGTITLTSTCHDAAGNSASDSRTVKVDTTAPVVAYSGNAGSYSVDQTVSISCSASDTLSGVASSTCADVSGPAWSFGLGTHTVSASATDNAGNTGSSSASFTVTVDATSLCGLVHQFVSNAGIANSLCVKLQNAAAAGARGQAKTKANILDAFDSEVRAQSGKAMTAAQAALLVQFAAAL